jgi:hypothetical protein
VSELREVAPLIYLVTLVALSLASLVWTTRRSRRLLSELLNRPLQPGEESSIGVWMRLSSEQIEAGQRRLSADPFGRLERALTTFGSRRG